MEFHGISLESMEFHMIQWNSMDSMEFNPEGDKLQPAIPSDFQWWPYTVELDALIIFPIFLSKSNISPVVKSPGLYVRL